MKSLYLLRHAQAREGGAGVSDHDRTLTRRGAQSCADIGPTLSSLPAPEIALCSSALRTQETCERTQGHWSEVPQIEIEPRLYLASPDGLLDVLCETDPAINRALVVGHQPGLQQLAFQLTQESAGGERDRAWGAFPPATLVILEFASESWHLKSGSGVLTHFATPDDKTVHDD